MFFWFPSNILYMRPNVDGSKHQENQVKVTDVKRCSFCTLQENIQIVPHLFRAFKKQITIQAKLSCCYCSGSVLILLHSTKCKNGVAQYCSVHQPEETPTSVPITWHTIKQ